MQLTEQTEYCVCGGETVKFKLDIHVIGMQLGEGREETENYT